MEWLTQNWIWIAVLIGVVAFLGFSRRGHGRHGNHGGEHGATGHVRLGGCCGGHGKQPPSDKPGAAHGHQH